MFADVQLLHVASGQFLKLDDLVNSLKEATMALAINPFAEQAVGRSLVLRRHLPTAIRIVPEHAVTP